MNVEISFITSKRSDDKKSSKKKMELLSTWMMDFWESPACLLPNGDLTSEFSVGY